MRKMLLAFGVAALAVSGPVLARGQGGGGGHGRGHDASQSERGGGDRGNRGGRDRGRDEVRGGGQDRGDRGRGRGRDDGVERGRGGQERVADDRGRGRGRGDMSERGRGREDRIVRQDDDRGRGRGRDDALERGRGREDRAAVRIDDRGRGDDRRRGDRRLERRAIVITEPARVMRFERGPRFAFRPGCPPGLARRDNGCLPPGHARQLAASRFWYDDWWGIRPASGLYRYDDGYLYNIRPDGGVAGFLPLLGGALWPGEVWPASYASYPVPDYYVDYYGYDDPYNYRYADGVIYGLDPSSNAIREVVALVTGDPWAIGSPMPAGYDVYNVPYAYRSQYFDRPDAWYRYSDGYVYQVDPTTQLVQAVIQLIA